MCVFDEAPAVNSIGVQDLTFACNDFADDGVMPIELTSSGISQVCMAASRARWFVANRAIGALLSKNPRRGMLRAPPDEKLLIH